MAAVYLRWRQMPQQEYRHIQKKTQVKTVYQIPDRRARRDFSTMLRNLDFTVSVTGMHCGQSTLDDSIIYIYHSASRILY